MRRLWLIVLCLGACAQSAPRPVAPQTFFAQGRVGDGVRALEDRAARRVDLPRAELARWLLARARLRQALGHRDAAADLRAAERLVGRAARAAMTADAVALSPQGAPPDVVTWRLAEWAAVAPPGASPPANLVPARARGSALLAAALRVEHAAGAWRASAYVHALRAAPQAEAGALVVMARVGLARGQDVTPLLDRLLALPGADRLFTSLCLGPDAPVSHAGCGVALGDLAQSQSRRAPVAWRSSTGAPTSASPDPGVVAAWSAFAASDAATAARESWPRWLVRPGCAEDDVRFAAELGETWAALALDPATAERAVAAFVGGPLSLHCRGFVGVALLAARGLWPAALELSQGLVRESPFDEPASVLAARVAAWSGNPRLSLLLLVQIEARSVRRGRASRLVVPALLTRDVALALQAARNATEWAQDEGERYWAWITVAAASAAGGRHEVALSASTHVQSRWPSAREASDRFTASFTRELSQGAGAAPSSELTPGGIALLVHDWLALDE